MHVLVVDNSRYMRLLMTRVLNQTGLDPRVTEAAGGQDALDMLETTPVDVVLCDWDMPIMDGLELLTRLRASGSSVPFILITSTLTMTRQRQVAQAGSAAVLPKPLTPTVLASTVRRLR